MGNLKLYFILRLMCRPFPTDQYNRFLKIKTCMYFV